MHNRRGLLKGKWPRALNGMWLKIQHHTQASLKVVGPHWLRYMTMGRHDLISSGCTL